MHKLTSKLSHTVYTKSELFFTNLSFESGFHSMKYQSLEYDKKVPVNIDFQKYGEVVFKYMAGRTVEVVIKNDDYLMSVKLQPVRGRADIGISGISFAITEKICERVFAEFPKFQDGEDEISVKFWNDTPNGPTSRSRQIGVPRWKEIQHNYNSDTRNALEQLILNFRPEVGGQLILWHGVPGTGKTFALRALCKEWKSWCKSEYILDPEALFGNPSYLTDMVFSDDDNYVDIDEEEESTESAEKQWKLLILEDTGELLSEDAKDRTGQGLSRLLNLADGFIGQGLKVIVLITTNEELHSLHPAVARPGRCAASIKFNLLNRADITEWAEYHKIAVPQKWPITVAELYEIINQQHQIVTTTKQERIGFQVA